MPAASGDAASALAAISARAALAPRIRKLQSAAVAAARRDARLIVFTP